MGDARLDQHWLTGASAGGVGQWIDNGMGEILSVDLEGCAVPLVLGHDQRQASYVASLISAWVRYPLIEAERAIHPRWIPALQGLGLGIGALLRQAGLDRAAILDNWLLSTNLHPVASARAWTQAREAALALVPDRPLAMRSICDQVNPELCAHLRADGWLMVPARLIYLCDSDPIRLMARGHVRRDAKLLERPDVELLGPDDLTLGDIPALRQCFRQVFFGKHPPLNPDFSNAFFELCLTQRYCDLYALRHDGQIVGVLALLARHGWMTTPLIGYDTDRPVALGLYRRLMALLLAKSQSAKSRLHYSSGAGQFKIARGGEPALEYTAIYTRHLPAQKRIAARLFATTMARFGADTIRRFS
jgi:hypothetical protein